MAHELFQWSLRTLDFSEDGLKNAAKALVK
jgi:hypothetical protein